MLRRSLLIEHYIRMKANVIYVSYSKCNLDFFLVSFLSTCGKMGIFFQQLLVICQYPTSM